MPLILGAVDHAIALPNPVELVASVEESATDEVVETLLLSAVSVGAGEFVADGCIVRMSVIMSCILKDKNPERCELF